MSLKGLLTTLTDVQAHCASLPIQYYIGGGDPNFK